MLLPASPMPYLITHPLPTPGILGKQPELPKKTFSHLSHTASAALPLPKLKCGGTEGRSQYKVQLEKADLFSIPFQGSKHSMVRVYSQYLHSPICSLLLHSQCLQRPREPGQVCSQSCARGLWSHQQHQTLSPSTVWACLCHPNPCTGLLSPSCHKSWQQLQEDTRCGTAGVPCRVS